MNLISKADMNFIIKNKELSYLNLDWDLIKKLQHANQHPFKKRTIRPDLDLLRIIRDPTNFHFTCSAILNKDIHPFQNVCLQELWNRPFPMLLGSRGASKCLNKDTYIQTKNKICKIADLIPEDYPDNTKFYPEEKYLVGENGYSEIDYVWSNGNTNTIIVKTNFGYEIEVTLDHKLRVVRDNNIEWIEAQDLKLGDKIVISRNEENIFPNNKKLPADLAYLFGLLVGDGGYTIRGKISFTTSDKILADKVSKIAQKYFNKPFKKDSSKYSYNLYGVSIWDDLFHKYGFNSSECGLKDFPASVLSSDKESVCAFISGLMDTDGFINKRLDTIGIAAKSKNIIKTLQFILSRLGIISRICPQWNKKYERFYYYLTIRGNNISIFNDKIGFELPRKQELLDKASLINRNTNKDVLPRSLVLKDVLSLSEAWRMFRPEGKRGYFYERQLLTPSRLKNYELSYETMLKILNLTKELDSRDDWKRLKSICNKNYFYDNIIQLRTNKDITYDVHLKTDHSFITNGFISHNTFMLGLYCALRATINQGCKIVITGAAFRQAKVVFEYIEQLWDTAPVWRDLVGSDKRNGSHHDSDRWWFGIGDSTISALPIGDGGKIRGYRANYLISDEFASQNPDIYENVIAGFAFVSANPIEKVKEAAIIETYKKLNIWGKEQEDKLRDNYMGNQSILAGTAYYDWNHLYKYYKRYKSIIQSQGDPKKLAEIFQGSSPEGFDYKDYSIIRLPLELMPKGLMDEKQVQRSKVTTHSTNYLMEFGACFAHDSDGFFKRTLIESCVCKGNISKADGVVKFKAVVVGSPANRYVYGIDPAAESDKFSIVVLELHSDHNRIVYCWTTDKADHREKLKAGIVKENSFYAYINDKVRALMKIFPCVHIAMDSQGGGGSVMESFRDKDKLKEGEQPLLLITPDNPLSDKKERECDGEAGLHIVELINFAKYDWTAPANHNMRMDFEHQDLLFPYFDPLELGIASELDLREGRMYDTLEECVLEIEDLKDELATIVMTATSVTGREHWDTPETKESGTKKGRMRKDRYSALLMANASARVLYKYMPTPYYTPSGGFVGKVTKATGKLYTGPAWFINQMGHYGNAISKRGD